MKIKEKLLFITFFILLLTYIEGISDNKNETIYVQQNKEKLQSISSNNESSVEFINKEFNYYAPKSGSVNLAWRIKNYPEEEALGWNDNTKLAYGLMYLPMEEHGDTFSIKLKVPIGAIFQYYFWISKNKQGVFQDFWDTSSSEKITITDGKAIRKNAVYSEVERKRGSQILTKGWFILLFLISIYLLIVWLQKKWEIKINTPSKIEKIFFTGISLILFHALARSEIIHVNLIRIIHNLDVLTKIIRGSINDFIYIGCLVTVFILAFFLIENEKTRRLLFGFFIFLALFSTVVAFTNITTVIFLGKPFNYQWLYYSGFLGSMEAKTAIQENLSANVILNLIAICISVLVLSFSLQKAFRLLMLNKYIKIVVFVILVFALPVIIREVTKTKATWTRGQSENAITSMAYSMLTVNKNTSFFTAKISKNNKSFNPAESKKSNENFNDKKGNKVENILFIVLESAGATYFDEYGGNYQLSPNLNKYACQALIFDQMYAHAPSTDRSLVSILGSMYPYLSYKSLTQEAPNFNFPTLSSVLKSNGYRTSFFTSADLRFQNCDEFLIHRGFDLVEDFASIKCGGQFKLDRSDYKEGNGIDDMCLYNRLTTWLEEDSTKSFFSMIWTVQGHYPYFFAKEEFDFGVTEYNLNRYLNCLKYNDELIGKVMQTLEDKGLSSKTLVVVVGDHGEAFGQHQQYGHANHIYEENIKVPLYFINNTLFHGEHKSDISGMKDLATTALSILDIDIPKQWQGRNLLGTISNEAFYYASFSDGLFGYRKDQMKYIFNESQNTVEVFDLNADPAENINLLDYNITEVENARNRVAAWVQFQDKFVKQIVKKEN